METASRELKSALLSFALDEGLTRTVCLSVTLVGLAGAVGYFFDGFVTREERHATDEQTTEVTVTRLHAPAAVSLAYGASVLPCALMLSRAGDIDKTGRSLGGLFRVAQDGLTDVNPNIAELRARLTRDTACMQAALGLAGLGSLAFFAANVYLARDLPNDGFARALWRNKLYLAPLPLSLTFWFADALRSIATPAHHLLSHYLF